MREKVFAAGRAFDGLVRHWPRILLAPPPPPPPLSEFSSEQEIGEFLLREGIDLFVNHTSCSFMPNPAPFGIYMAMFPLEFSAEKSAALSSYQFICCNSHFTRFYVRRRWGENLNSVVIPPPISEVHLSQNSISFDQKEKLIINVGRFNVGGHQKCQDQAIRAFGELNQQGILDSSWQLTVAGHVNRSPENDAYLESCRRAADGLNVEVLTNISLAELCALYRRASALWQFTGVNLPFGVNPGHCEHLGLVALDSFAYGVIPIAYQRGGMSYFIKHGVNGFVFSDIAELAEIMKLISDSYRSSAHRSLFENSVQSKTDFTFEAFRRRITELIPKDLLGRT